VVHFLVHGAEIFPGNLGGNVKFQSPPEIPLTYPRNSGGPEIPPQGRNFRPQRLVYKRRGRGEDTLWHLLPPPNPLSPNRRCPLIKTFFGDSLAAGISGSRRPVLSSTWGVSSSASFSPWMTVLSQISHPRCPCPSSCLVWADPFFCCKELISRGSIVPREPSIELRLVPIYFFQRFLSLFRSFLTRPEFPPLGPEIPGMGRKFHPIGRNFRPLQSDHYDLEGSSLFWFHTSSVVGMTNGACHGPS
jgi:hypothetical protein